MSTFTTTPARRTQRPPRHPPARTPAPTPTPTRTIKWTRNAPPSSTEPPLAARGRARLRSLARYRSSTGEAREVVSLGAMRGTLLVIDRDRATRGDQRLVAHLGADEPLGNADLVCELYLQAVLLAGIGLPRTVQAEDLLVDPYTIAPRRVARRHDPRARESREPGAAPDGPSLVDAAGAAYRLEIVGAGAGQGMELRWLRYAPGQTGPGTAITLRDLIGVLQSYEPAREASEQAVARHANDPDVSVVTLSDELLRLHSSRIVLNRGLREAALTTMQRRGLSLAEIALRCGRSKPDKRGNLSGESTWLARRIGLKGEAGGRAPTPWVHSDTLGLIARDGLRLAPHEVELG
jgi:hypothetical protein